MAHNLKVNNSELPDCKEHSLEKLREIPPLYKTSINAEPTLLQIIRNRSFDNFKIHNVSLNE